LAEPAPIIPAGYIKPGNLIDHVERRTRGKTLEVGGHEYLLVRGGLTGRCYLGEGCQRETGGDTGEESVFHDELYSTDSEDCYDRCVTFVTLGRKPEFGN